MTEGLGLPLDGGKTLGRKKVSARCTVRGVRANLELVDAPGKVIGSLRASEASARRASSTLRHASTSPPALKATFTRHDRDYRLFAEYNESINHLPRFIVERKPWGASIDLFLFCHSLFYLLWNFSSMIRGMWLEFTFVGWKGRKEVWVGFAWILGIFRAKRVLLRLEWFIVSCFERAVRC